MRVQEGSGQVGIVLDRSEQFRIGQTGHLKDGSGKGGWGGQVQVQDRSRHFMTDNERSFQIGKFHVMSDRESSCHDRYGKFMS